MSWGWPELASCSDESLIIACMLITLWSGRKPTLRTYEMICFCFTDLADEEERSRTARNYNPTPPDPRSCLLDAWPFMQREPQPQQGPLPCDGSAPLHISDQPFVTLQVACRARPFEQ